MLGLMTVGTKIECNIDIELELAIEKIHRIKREGNKLIE